jgi:7-cyano-7-deazaguanine synthase
MSPGLAIILLSGGQDSTTCLFWALEQGYDVACLSIWYGQRHKIELQAAQDVVRIARTHYPGRRIDHENLPVGNVLNSTSPLVSSNDLGKYENIADLPGGVEPTFVPGRNILFLTLAANRAAELDATAIITGLCQEDFGGYYDCRREFVDAMEIAIAQGLIGQNTWLSIETPLMDLDKGASVKMAADLRGCMEALGSSHTCYAGEFPPCGTCHACHLRARGFEEAGVPDPLISEART